MPAKTMTIQDYSDIKSGDERDLTLVGPLPDGAVITVRGSLTLKGDIGKGVSVVCRGEDSLLHINTTVVGEGSKFACKNGKLVINELKTISGLKLTSKQTYLNGEVVKSGEGFSVYASSDAGDVVVSAASSGSATVNSFGLFSTSSSSRRKSKKVTSRGRKKKNKASRVVEVERTASGTRIDWFVSPTKPACNTSSSSCSSTTSSDDTKTETRDQFIKRMMQESKNSYGLYVSFQGEQMCFRRGELVKRPGVVVSTFDGSTRRTTEGGVDVTNQHNPPSIVSSAAEIQYRDGAVEKIDESDVMSRLRSLSRR